LIAQNGLYLHQDYHPNNDDHFEISVEYQAIADFNKYLLLVDPMLATGQSIIAVFNRLMEEEVTKEIHIAVVIAAPGNT
jgi:uracil phosphoribosyltransferase